MDGRLLIEKLLAYGKAHSRPKKEKFGGGLLRFIDFLESVFYGGRAVIDFPVSAKILIILR